MINKLVHLVLIFLLSLAALYLIFLSVISISIGLANSSRPGFWMPIVWGVLIICLDLFMLRLVVYLFKRIRARKKYPYY